MSENAEEKPAARDPNARAPNERPAPAEPGDGQMTPQEAACLRRVNRILVALLLAVSALSVGWAGWSVYRTYFYEPSTGHLVDTLESGDEFRRLGAAYLLGLRLDEPLAVRALSRALRDKAPGVRTAAAVALRKAGPRAAPVVAELIRASRDDAPDVRWATTAALGETRVTTEGVVRALVARLDDRHDRVQWAARESLMDLVRANPSLRPLVEEALAATPDEHALLRLRLQRDAAADARANEAGR